MAEQKELKGVLKDLRAQLKRQTSLRFAFVRGLVYGIGTVIGATVLIGVLSWVLTSLFDEPSDVPIVGEVVEDME